MTGPRQRHGREPASRRALACLAVVAVWCLGGALAQPAFERLDVRGQFRDALIDPASRSLIIADYNRGEVLRVSMDSPADTRRITTGKGPAALALSHDGAVVACVNRLNNTVSLIDAISFELIATVPVGQGPVAITALPAGGFAIANSFDDNVVILDQISRLVRGTIGVPGAVPVAVAATNTRLAVALRAPASLALYGLNDSSPAHVSKLDGPPVALVALDDRFVVTTATSILAIDQDSGGIVAELPLNVRDLTVAGDRVIALATGTLHVLDKSLRETETLALDMDARGVAAALGVYALVSPADQSIYVAGVLSEAPMRAPTPAPIQPVVEPALPLARPPVVEAQDVPPVGPKPQPPGPVVEQPAPPQPSPPPTPPETPRPAESAPTTPVGQATEHVHVHPQPVPGLSEAEEEALRARMSLRPPPVPLGLSGTRAPRLGSIPEAPFGSRGWVEALLGTREGFVIPDMSQEFLVEADALEGDASRQVFTGNARFTLQDTLFRADRIIRDDTTGEIEAIGNVVITQAEASVRADRVYFRRAPEGPEGEGPPVFRSPGVAPLEGPVWRPGIFEADNLALSDPARDIKAEFIHVDLGERTGELRNAEGRAGQVYFGAEKLVVHGPEAIDAYEAWVSTCPEAAPPYRIRFKEASLREGDVLVGRNVRLQLGRIDTPLYVPRYRSRGLGPNRRTSFDFDTGREAELGYFLNVAQWYELSPHVSGAVRLLPTQKEGFGYGIDLDYDFMDATGSPWFRTKGELHTLYTTHERGYTEWYHRQEFRGDYVLLAQWEQWYDRDFIKDFFYSIYRDRTGPRTFANMTRTRPDYIATLTVSESTHDFTRETEKFPEATFHLLERPLTNDLYFTFDTATGQYQREPFGENATRTVNLARLSYDWEIAEGLNAVPFVEGEAAWYSNTRDDGDPHSRLTAKAGVTLQSRLHRSYPGRWGFAGFKHIIIPSVTYFYRPEPSLDAQDTPQFDALDTVPGRSRLESKIDNIILGRDATTNETWQVARVSLYQGNDFWNEFRKTNDYEIEFDVRPRPWWGFLAVGEHHSIDDDSDWALRVRRFVNRLGQRLGFEGPRTNFLDLSQGDFDRVLAYVYYDDGDIRDTLNARIGFAYTETDDEIFNREVLYGVGFKATEKWSFAFEHRYDLERDELTRQTYEIRRRLNCWDLAIQLRDRESGFDVGFEISLIGIPGASLRL